MNTEKLSNEVMNPPLRKGVVSGSYTLLLMKSQCISGWKKSWHIQNTSGTGQNEYTLCGMSWVDGDADIRDMLFIKSKKGGKITCYKCLGLLEWCKRVK